MIGSTLPLKLGLCHLILVVLIVILIHTHVAEMCLYYKLCNVIVTYYMKCILLSA